MMCPSFLYRMAVKSKVKSRDGPRLKWNNDDMMAAMEAVSSNKVTITSAPRELNVPRKTIDDRVKGRVTHGKKPGVSTVLTTQEEESLAKYLIYVYGGARLSTHKNNGQGLWLGNIKMLRSR